MNKKILVLGCTLIIALVSFNLVNAKVSEKVESLIYPEAILNKYITKSDEKNNLYDIVLEVEGKNKIDNPPTDVVLVVDESNSMTGERFKKAKAAVKAFVGNIFEASENVNIGYVGFANDVLEDKVKNLTDDKTALVNFIDSQEINQGGATHLHAGIKKAKDMLEARPSNHQKVIVILSDGVATYAYKPTSIAPINDNEVKAFDYLEPKYKVTGYDYNERIGSGGTFDLLDQTFKLDNTIISNVGDPTIGELLEFKKGTNNKVYSVGIEVENTDIVNGTYEYENSKYHASVGEYTIKTSWDETIKNGLYDPNEIITTTAEYTNESGANVTFSMNHNVVQDSDVRPVPAKTREYVENTGEDIAHIYVNDVLVESLTFDEVMDRPLNNTLGRVTLTPGDTYKIVTTFTMKNFTLLGPGKDSLNTMHLAQYNFRLNSLSSTAFCFDQSVNKGPILGFHSTYETKGQAEYILKNLSSDGIEGSTYYDVDNKDKLLDVLNKDLLNKLTDSIIDGEINDPMGAQYIEFQKGSFLDNDYQIWAEKNGEKDASLLDGVEVKYDSATKTLKATGLNLSVNEKVYIKYRVKLMVDKADFKYDTWYPTNERTTLTPFNGAEARDFPIPKVSASEKKEEDPIILEPDPEKPKPELPKTGSNNIAIILVLLVTSIIGLAPVVVRK